MHSGRVLSIQTDAVYSQAFLTQALLKRLSVRVLCSISVEQVERDDAPSGTRSNVMLSCYVCDF
jgi:hypothetical protein